MIDAQGSARLGEERPLVLVACSGGADSLALASAVAFVAPREGLRAGLVTVDHRLQPGSAEQGRTVVAWGGGVGLDPCVCVPVSVAGRPGGVEAAAREARYEALARVAHEHGARAVLLGHTRDDQAETVLLALLRGGGPRGVAGMPVLREFHGVDFVRPLLSVSRAQTRAACAALGIEVWEDPLNDDPAYARTHARALLASLSDALGPGVAGNLAQTARLVAADNEALDQWAARVLAGGGEGAPKRRGTGTECGADPRERADASGDGIGSGLSCADLAALPAAVRTRVLHGWALLLGCAGTDLSHRHVDALDRLVTCWHGQGPVHLPGGTPVRRIAGHLVAG